jgi:hypothetical protein
VGSGVPLDGGPVGPVVAGPDRERTDRLGSVKGPAGRCRRQAGVDGRRCVRVRHLVMLVDHLGASRIGLLLLQANRPFRLSARSVARCLRPKWDSSWDARQSRGVGPSPSLVPLNCVRGPSRRSRSVAMTARPGVGLEVACSRPDPYLRDGSGICGERVDASSICLRFRLCGRSGLYADDFAHVVDRLDGYHERHECGRREPA